MRSARVVSVALTLLLSLPVTVLASNHNSPGRPAGTPGGGNAPAQSGGQAQGGAKARAEARAQMKAEVKAKLESKARLEAMGEAMARLQAAIDKVADAAKPRLQAIVDKVKAMMQAEREGKPVDMLQALEVMQELQATAESPALDAESKTKLKGVIDELNQQAQASLGTKKASPRAAEARAKVSARLQEMLASGRIKNENAQANILDVIERLKAAAKEAGATEEEALGEVEATLEEKEEVTAADLDVLAEVKAKLGKKAEARAALKARLEANPRTKKAYERLLELEAEAGTKQDLDTFVNGKKVTFDVRPAIKDGRTLVPVRALVEALGADVKWNPETRVVTILKGDTTIELAIGSNIAKINGREVTMDVPAEIFPGNRTMIPARFVSEGMKLVVNWLAEQRSIVVTEEPLEAEASTSP